MPDKSLSLPLRRLFGLSDEFNEFLLEPVAVGPAPITGAGDFESETLRRIWLFFEQNRGSRAMLSRADIDPGDLRHVLSRVALIEVYHEPRRYRMRLVGTHLTSAFGFDPTGKWVDQWPDATGQQLLETTFELTVAAKRAHYMRRRASIGRATLLFETMILPLSSDGEIINMLLTIGAPWQSNRTLAPPVGKI